MATKSEGATHQTLVSCHPPCRRRENRLRRRGSLSFSHLKESREIPKWLLTLWHLFAGLHHGDYLILTIYNYLCFHLKREFHCPNISQLSTDSYFSEGFFNHQPASIIPSECYGSWIPMSGTPAKIEPLDVPNSLSCGLQQVGNPARLGNLMYVHMGVSINWGTPHSWMVYVMANAIKNG